MQGEHGFSTAEKALDVLDNVASQENGVGLTELSREIDMVPSPVFYRLGEEADDPKAEAVFIGRTTVRTLEILRPLEQDLDKPVMTGNQATTWDSIQLAAITPTLEGVANPIVYDHHGRWTA